jgi:putative ABC transport system permease protein
VKRQTQLPLPPNGFGLRDNLMEALAGALQRPGRAALTMLGTVLGVGAFVTILGLTSTAAGQISRQFTILQATTVTVIDSAAVDEASRPDQVSAENAARPAISFPADADQRVQKLNGVQAAGVWWSVPLGDSAVSSTPTGAANGEGLKVFAATPGAVVAMELTLTSGVSMDPFMQRSSGHVVMLSSVAAQRLGVHSLNARPAVFIGDTPYTVVGIYTEAKRNPEIALGAVIPESTALADFGNPDPGDMPATMVIATKVGAAELVARQAPLALRPDATDRLTAVAPPDPHTLHDKVSNDLTGLFIALATVSLVIGAVGIANTTLVSVLERVGEIGLRRALGARPRHIAAQFLTESLLSGTIGGMVGTSLGVIAVMIVAEVRQWTAVIDPAVTLAAPALGSAVGLLAGLYPALRAARISPITALRS